MTNETQAWASRYFGVRPYNLTQEQLDFAQRALDMGLDYTLDLPRKPVNLPQPVYIDCDNGMNWYIVPVALANNLRLAIEEQGFLGKIGRSTARMTTTTLMWGCMQLLTSKSQWP